MSELLAALRFLSGATTEISANSANLLPAKNILSLFESSDEATSQGGLGFEYATQWSYGIGETFNLLIPNFRGGSSNGKLSEKSEIYKLYSQGNRNQAKQIIKQLPLYWGPQPFTEGPAYMGALTIFLFVFAMFFLKNREKWWVFAISILSIMLAWGDHFEVFNRLVFDYLPLYNKFRAVTTTLFILQLTIPLLGILAINKLFTEFDKNEFLKAIKWSFAIVGGICLLFTFFPGLAGNFTGFSDGPYLENKAFMQAIIADRESILQVDALRSSIYVISGAGLLLFYVYGKLNKLTVGTLLGVLLVLDLVLVNTRFVSYNDFQTVRSTKNSFQPTIADLSIYQTEVSDPDVKRGVKEFMDTHKMNPLMQNHESPELLALNLTTNYRVINLSGGINFSDAKTSYYHKSLSGYSPAKLRRYQDLLDRGILEQQIKNFASAFQSNSNTNSYSLFNMLNTKYVVFNSDQPAFVNRNALGNAWFVKNVIWVKNADEEFSLMTRVEPQNDAAINIEFKEQGIDDIGFDPSATIDLINYKPNHLTYHSKTTSRMLAVFSEIYYPKGWKVYIDGKHVNYFRANYLFRALVVPSGDHKIEFKFEPRSYLLGNRINYIASLILLLSTVILLAYNFRENFFINRKVQE